MEEAEFRKLADGELKLLSDRLDQVKDLDVDLSNDILVIEFPDGEKFVANLQGPTRQIWFAAHFAAGHFEYDATRRCWKDTKTAEELRVRIARDVGSKLGKPIDLS
jgi:iron donor protein CyaY